MRHSSFSASPVIFRSTSPEGNDQGKLGDSRNSAAVSESEVKCSHVRDVFYSQDSVCTRLRSVPSGTQEFANPPTPLPVRAGEQIAASLVDLIFLFDRVASDSAAGDYPELS